jgi:hypothetical protein
MRKAKVLLRRKTGRVQAAVGLKLLDSASARPRQGTQSVKERA